MRVKYNRVSTEKQNGQRFEIDKERYDLTLLDHVSGSIAFKDRPKGKILAGLIEDGKVTEIVLEDFSRIGRNTGDVISNMEWLEEKSVNVIVRNLGLESRPNGKKNPVWKMITSVMSSMYEMELQNIKERTSAGRAMYIQKGGFIGRPVGTTESKADFLNKETSVQILKQIKKGKTVRDISKILSLSTSTIMKVKRISEELSLKTTTKKPG
jgi:DNA invertase Pin-like site-specific DNA recombinase